MSDIILFAVLRTLIVYRYIKQYGSGFILFLLLYYEFRLGEMIVAASSDGSGG